MRTVKIISINVAVTVGLFLILELSARLAFPNIGIPGTDRRFFFDSMYYDSPGLKPNVIGISNGTKKQTNNSCRV